MPVGALDINLYRDDWTRLHTQPVVKATDLPFGIDDREVVLIDDVLFTGRTIGRLSMPSWITAARERSGWGAGRPRTPGTPDFAQFVGLLLNTSIDEQVNVLLAEKDGIDQVVTERASA